MTADTRIPTLDALTDSAVPIVLTCLLVLAAILPLPLPHYSIMAPALPLMVIYYWSIYQPDLISHILVFSIGLLVDTFSGTPIGVYALMFLVVQGVVVANRHFLLGKSFWVLWLGFLLVAPSALILAWLIISALAGSLVAPLAMLFQLLATVAVFPWVAWLLLLSQRRIHVMR